MADEERLSPNSIEIDFMPVGLHEIEKLIEEFKAGKLDPEIPIFADGGGLRALGYQRNLLAAQHAGVPSVRCIRIADELSYLRTYFAEQVLPNDHPIDVARWLSHYQERLGFTQGELGRHFGLKQPAVSKYLKIAKYLYVETVWKVLDETAKEDANHVRQFGRPGHRGEGHRIGFRHLYDLTRIHHRNSDCPLSEENAKRFQIQLVDQLVAYQMGVKEFSKKIREHLRTSRKRQAAVTLNSNTIQIYRGTPCCMESVVSTDSIHLVLTAPPHLQQKSVQANDLQGYLEELIPPLQVATRTLVPGGYMIVNLADPWVAPHRFLPIRDIVICALLEMKMVWCGQTVLESSPVGKEKEKEAMTDFEYLLVFKKPMKRRGRRRGPRRKDPAQYAEDTLEEWAKFKSILPFTYDLPTSDNPRAERFPGSLVDLCIRIFSDRGETVLDPFIGRNAALIEATTKHDRSVIGFDTNDPHATELLGLFSEGLASRIVRKLPSQWRKIASILTDLL